MMKAFVYLFIYVLIEIFPLFMQMIFYKLGRLTFKNVLKIGIYTVCSFLNAVVCIIVSKSFLGEKAADYSRLIYQRVFLDFIYSLDYDNESIKDSQLRTWLTIIFIAEIVYVCYYIYNEKIRGKIPTQNKERDLK